MKKLEKLRERSKILNKELFDVRKEIDKLEAEEKRNKSQSYVGKYFKNIDKVLRGVNIVYYVYDVDIINNSPVAIEFTVYDDSEYFSTEKSTMFSSYLRNGNVEECTKEEFDVVKNLCLSRIENIISKINK